MAQQETTANPPSGRRKVDVPGIVQLALILVVVVVAIYYARSPAGVSVDDRQVGTVPRPTVSVIHPVATRAAREVTTTGVVEVVGGVSLGSQVTGEVVYVSPALRNGGSFTAGQPLVRLDRQDYEIRLDAAKARLREAQARLDKQRAKAEVKQAQFRREQPGVEVPRFVARIPQIARAQARLDRAEVTVRKAELDLARTTISLPFDGWVRNSGLHVGQLVGLVRPLGQVFAKDAMRVEAQISQQDQAALEPIMGHPATVRTTDGRTFDVVVERVSAVVDRQSRQATLYLAFVDDLAVKDLPRPGTFVNVVLSGRPMDGVMVLPEAAEQPTGSIWLVEAGALTTFVPRSLGRNSTGWLVEAFDPKEGVLTGPVAQPRVGMPVNAVNAADLEP